MLVTKSIFRFEKDIFNLGFELGQRFESVSSSFLHLSENRYSFVDDNASSVAVSKNGIISRITLSASTFFKSTNIDFERDEFAKFKIQTEFEKHLELHCKYAPPNENHNLSKGDYLTFIFGDFSLALALIERIE